MSLAHASAAASVKWVGWLRRRIRSSELWLIAVATLIGVAAGTFAVVQAQVAHGLQMLLFEIDINERLSAQSHVAPWRLLAIPAGGLLLGGITWAWMKYRPRPAVDPVEANALHGGRLSMKDSAFICGQTMLSNGVGASVGLEAAYAQAGAAAASFAGQRLNLRRADMRTLVGAGAGAAIAAAFGAPLTGAFYAFEIVIGAYTVANLAPVVAAALAAVLVASKMGAIPYLLKTDTQAVQSWTDYGLYALVGLACAIVGIGLMRLVANAERLVTRSPIPRWLRPAIGGMGLAALAVITPQTLSAGHGALHLNLMAEAPLKLLLMLLAMKALASVISLSFGFRGGLFFASLFLGALLGQVFSAISLLIPWAPSLDPTVAALVGMAALGVAVVGGPFTMSFLVLEATGDFTVAAAALVASMIASAMVRETFGYSFSTWRLHLRGETIRSAHDVSWMRPLSAGRMMRKDVQTVPAETTLAEFRRRFPLGSTKRVIMVDEAGLYAGVIPTAKAYADGGDGERSVAGLAINADTALKPEQSIKDVMRAFDRSETDELAVIDDKKNVLGVLSEAYATRRYAEELEKARRELTGEAG